MTEHHLIWQGKMLPPMDHTKLCRLCGKVIKVGDAFGLMMPTTYPPKKHHVVHVSCFTDASVEPVVEAAQAFEVISDCVEDVIRSLWK